MKEQTRITRIAALFLVLVMAAPQLLVAVTGAPELPDPGSPAGITRDQQIQVGLQAMAQVYQQMPVLPDSSPVTQYVQSLGRKLVPVIPPEHSWPYQFHVIQQSDINAFALPGGPIFINLGTITAADNEAELAGVMSHEMSHVYMQHSAKAAGKQAMEQGLLGVLGSILGGRGALGNIAAMGIQLGAGFLSLKYSRADEAQADSTGAIIMYKAGYNPRAMAEFFQKLEQGGKSGPQFLSDHPNPGNRVAAVDKEIQNWPPENYQPTSQAFVSAKQQAAGTKAYTAQQIADGAKAGTWAQQNRKNGAIPPNLPKVPAGSGGTASNGSTAGNGSISSVTPQQAKPSSHFIQMNQGGVSISHPDNWQVFNSGDPNAGITIAPPAGVSQGSVAYGVVINAAQDQNAGSLDQATQNLIQNLQQSNSGLQLSGSISRVTVNGVQGRSANLIGPSPVLQNGQPVPERDWLVTVPTPQGNGAFVFLVFVAPQSAFNQFNSTYKKMLKSLRLQ